MKPSSNKLSIPVKKIISGFLILVILLSQTAVVPLSFSQVEQDHVDIIAFLVEEEALNAPKLYQGLGFFGSTTLKERIDRYANDIRLKKPDQKILILPIPKDTPPDIIQNVLEHIYFQGDESLEINSLRGLVVIGNVALPTVMSQNISYTSIFPYTDFIQPKFQFNQNSQLFEEREGITAQAEIWHGVIAPSGNDEERYEKLASFFDKNHAFYSKINGYDQFDQKVFFGNIPQDYKKMQQQKLPYYQSFLSSMEDLIYLRYSKKLAEKLYQSIQQGLSEKLSDYETQNDTFKSVPDIQLSTAIERMIARFSDLFGNYVSDIQGKVAGSGRWSTDDVDTFIHLITQKDEWSMRVIRTSNDTLETSIDTVVEKLQRPVEMIVGRSVSPIQRFRTEEENVVQGTETVQTYLYGNIASDIDDAALCSIYRGSTQIVEANRLYNPTNNPTQCNEYAGCCAKNLKFENGGFTSSSCAPTQATRPVFDLGGTVEKQGKTSYLACLDSTIPLSVSRRAQVGGEVVTKEISSIIEHKEPTNETLQAQVASRFAQSLPIDDPRYVDYQNKAKEYERLDYINFFDIPKDERSSLENTEQAVENLIQTKNTEILKKTYQANLKSFLKYALYLNPNISAQRQSDFEKNMLDLIIQKSGKTYSSQNRFMAFVEYYQDFVSSKANYEPDLENLSAQMLGANLTFKTLSSFIQNEGQTFENTNVQGVIEKTRFDAVAFPNLEMKKELEQKVPLSVLADALFWKDLSIDQKYQYIFEHYFISNNNESDKVYPPASNGYESALLHIPSSESGVFFSNTQQNFSDPEYEAALQILEQAASASIITSASTDPALQDKCGSFDGVELPEWFSALQCWMKEVSNLGVVKTNDGEGDTIDFSQYDLDPTGSGSQVSQNQNENTNVNSSQTVENTKATRLIFTTPTTSLQVGKSSEVVVTVTALSEQGYIDTSYSGEINIRLTKATERHGTVRGGNSISLSQGQATFVIDANPATSGSLHILGLGGQLLPAALSIPIAQGLSREDLKNISPNALYMTLVDDAQQGNFSHQMGQETIFQDNKMQALTSLSTSSSQPEVIARIKNQSIETDIAVSPLFPSQQFLTLEIQNEEEKLASIYIKPSKDIQVHAIENEQQMTQEKGIFILPESDTVLDAKEDGTVSITKDSVSFGNISPNKIDIASFSSWEFDPSFLSGYRFNLMFQNQKIATIIYRDTVPLFSIKKERTNLLNVLDSGMYIVSEKLTITAKKDTSAQFITLHDEESRIDIGESFASLEDMERLPFIGFEGDFKNQLFFAAHASVGESTKIYASPLLINYGDPLITLSGENSKNSLGFTQDIGKPLFQASKPVKKIFDMDFNHDGQVDILTWYEDNTIGLLQNFNQGERFKDMGILLLIQDAIVDMSVADMNKDGWQDIVIATNGTVSIFENQGATFVRKNIFTNNSLHVTSLETEDMDQDGNMDLVTYDDKGKLSIFYGTDTGISSLPQVIDTLSVKIQSQNVASDPLISFDTLQSRKKSDALVAEHSMVVSTSSGQERKNLNFVPGIDVNNLIVKKTIQDENGGTVLASDQLIFTTTLENRGTTMTNVSILDKLDTALSLIPDSVKCENCGTSWTSTDTEDMYYPVGAANISLGAGQTLTLSYRATFDAFPKLEVSVGDFEEGKDRWLDIMLKPSQNTGTTIFYFSESSRSYKKDIQTPEPPASNIPEEFQEDKNDNKIPDIFEKDEDGDQVPDFAQDHLNTRAQDDDGDGIPNSLDSYEDSEEQSLEDMSKSVRDTVNKAINLLCGNGQGGCVSLPLNMAFLSPGQYTVQAGPISIPAGFDQGYPIFGFPGPGVVPICTGPTCFGPSVFRFYLSPTLTGGLGIATCFGNYYTGIAFPPLPLAGNCFVQAVPLDAVTGDSMCKDINASFEDVISKAQEWSKKHNSGGVSLFQIGMTSSQGKQPAGQLNFDNGTFDVSTKRFTNDRPESFPDFIMNWVDRQIDEITNKLADLPNIYLTLPDFSGVVSQAKDLADTDLEIRSIKDVAEYLSAIPFLEVSSQRIPIKYPVLSSERIDQLIADYKTTFDNLEEQFKELPDDVKNSLQVQYDKATKKLKLNLDRLESYKKFPEQIEKIARWRTDILKQTLNFLEKIMGNYANYYVKNKRRAEQWMKLYKTVKETLKSWQALLNVFVDYRTSCTSCKNDRGNSMYWYLKLFSSLVPDLPIIQFPKWPDIVIDTSKINAKATIYLPDPQFIPQEIIVPRLPRISVQDLAKLSVDIDIPTLPPLPTLPNIWPKMPDFDLPTLPDLPPPPKIPKFFAELNTVFEIIDTVLYVWCFYKQGLPLVKEWELKPTIENMTERSGFLPSFDFLKLSLPSQSFSFIDQIRVDTYVNFKWETKALIEKLQEAAKELNSFQTNLYNAVPSTTPDVNVPVSNLPSEIQGMFGDIESFAQNLKQQENELVDIDTFAQILQEDQKKIQDRLGTQPIDFQNPFIPGQELSTSQEDLSLSQLLPDPKDWEKQLNHMAKNIAKLVDISTEEETKILSFFENPQDTYMLAASPLSDSQDQGAQVSRILKSSSFAPRVSAQENPAPSSSSVSLDQTNNEVMGLYLYDSKNKNITPLISYTAEQGNTTSFTLVDIDQDTDQDAIYLMGSTIYSKKNHTFESPVRPNNSQVVNRDFKDFIPSASTIHDIEWSSASKMASIHMDQELDNNTVAYKLTLYPFIGAFDVLHIRDENQMNGRKLYFVLEKDKEMLESFVDIQDTKNSIVTVDNLSTFTHAFELPEGFYYGKIESLEKQEEENTLAIGTWNQTMTFASDISGDTSAPVVEIQNGNILNIPVLQQATLTYDRLFDADTHIRELYWDTDKNADKDHDGLFTNDKDIIAKPQNQNVNGDSLSNMVQSFEPLTFGPFSEPGDHVYTLHVLDEANNETSIEVLIHVFIPGMTIQSASSQDRIVSGNTNPSAANEPFVLVRSRNGIFSYIKNPETENDQFITDEDGNFEITNFNNQKGIFVKDKAGKLIAEINEETGRIFIKDPEASIKLIPGTSQEHLHMDIMFENQVMANVYLIADPNKEIQINEDSLGSLYIKDMNLFDETVLSKMPFNAPSGASSVIGFDANKKEMLFALYPNGNIILYKTGLELILLPSENANSPVHLQIKQENSIKADILFPSFEKASLEQE